jgi:uncharacterized glyoxalase superfamily protein PhnB
MTPRLTAIAPYFLVADVVRAAEHYRDRLGFAIRGYFFEDPPVFAMVGRDELLIIMLALMERSRGGSNRAHKSIGIDAYIWTEDVDALFAELQQRGADIVGPPVLRMYGLKELEVRDGDGYVICFGQHIAAA